MIPGGGVVRFARPSSSSLVCVFFGDGKYKYSNAEGGGAKT
jgi:hypothetical protein